MRKTLITSGNRAASASVYLNDHGTTNYCHQRSGPSRLAGTDPSNSDTATAVCVGCVCACVRAAACARVCVRPFVRTLVRASVRSCVRDMFALYHGGKGR